MMLDDGGKDKSPASAAGGGDRLCFLSGTCPDERCGTKLYFPSYDSCVECPNCGQRHPLASLHDATEVTDPEVALHNMVRSVFMGNFAPKKTTDSVKVLGLSNYHCKLLSPLLTNYGMNKHGQAQPLRTLTQTQSDVFDCATLGDRAFLLAPEHVDVMGYGRDQTGSGRYLRNTLDVIRDANGDQEVLIPIHADGDGHCLVHGLSRALVGRELFWHALRTNLRDHFECNLDRYRHLFCEFVDAEEWPNIIAESDPDYVPGPNEVMGLQNIHIFGLANVLRRPVVLLDSLSGLQSCGDYSAVFLPVLSSPDACRGKDGSLNKPLCIAWSSSARNHFIALVGVKGRPLPKLPRWMLMKAWGAPKEAIDQYIEFDDQGMCTVGGDRTINEKYVQRLATAMESLFLNTYGVHPSLVADVYNYIYKRTGVVGERQEEIIQWTRQAAMDFKLYRCLMCAAVSEVAWAPGFTPPKGLQPGGKLYTLAERTHGPLKEGNLYDFPLEGVHCRYDASIDQLVLDLTVEQAVTCPFCQGREFRRVRANGQVVYVNFDRTSTPSSGSSMCTCGHKHFWQGVEYDNPPKVFKVPLNWKGTTIEEEVVWFANEGQPELNSNAFKIAESLVNKHYPGEFGNERLTQQVVEDILHNTANKEPAFKPPSLTDMPSSSHTSTDMPSQPGGATPICGAGPAAESMETAGSDVQQRQPGQNRDDGSPVRSAVTPASKIILTGNSRSLHKEELTMSEVEKNLRKRISENAPRQQQNSVEDRDTESRTNEPSVEEKASSSQTNKPLLEERSSGSPTNKQSAEERATKTPTGNQPTSDQVTSGVKGHTLVAMEMEPPSQTIQPPKNIRIKISSSEGKQATLSLDSATSYSQLQTLIEAKLHIPPARQRIKHGFPPKELRAPPSGEEGAGLPLRNGDKLTVEVLRDPNVRADAPFSGNVTAGIAGNRQSRPGSSEPQQLLDQATMLQEFQKRLEKMKEMEEENLEFQLTSHSIMATVSGMNLWDYSKDRPELFKKGGIFYKIVARDLGLEDGKHCMLPSITDKRFRYSASADQLELCLEPYGHFPVGPDIGDYERSALAQEAAAAAQSSQDPGTMEMGQSLIDVYVPSQRSLAMGQRSLEMTDTDMQGEDRPSSSRYVPFAGRGHSLGADGGTAGGSEIKSGKRKGKSASPRRTEIRDDPIEREDATRSGAAEKTVEVQSEKMDVGSEVKHPRNTVDQPSESCTESTGSEHSISESRGQSGTANTGDPVQIHATGGRSESAGGVDSNILPSTPMDTYEDTCAQSLSEGQAPTLPMEVDQSATERVAELHRFQTEPLLGVSQHAHSLLNRAASDPSSLLPTQASADGASTVEGEAAKKDPVTSEGDPGAVQSSGTSEPVIGSSANQTDASANEGAGYVSRRLGPGYSVLLKKDEDSS